MPNPSYWGEGFTDEMKAKGLLLSLEGPALELSTHHMGANRSIILPSDYLAMSLGDLGYNGGSGYNYYGSNYPGGQPNQTSDWDKFLQFNAIVGPIIGNILGTWMTTRASQQQTAQMAEMFDNMTEEQQTQVMQGYLVQMSLAKAGKSTADPNAMMNMQSMFGQANQGNVNNAYNNAFASLTQACGGNAQMLAALNSSGATIKGSGGFTIPTWVWLAAAGGLAYWYFNKQKKSV